jgi:hypothetical protein
MMGLPVRVIATSDIGRRWSADLAIFWVDRTAAGKEAILAN